MVGRQILVGSGGRWWGSSLFLHDRAGSVKWLQRHTGCHLVTTLRRLLRRLQRLPLQTGFFFIFDVNIFSFLSSGGLLVRGTVHCLALGIIERLK